MTDMDRITARYQSRFDVIWRGTMLPRGYNYDRALNRSLFPALRQETPQNALSILENLLRSIASQDNISEASRRTRELKPRHIIEDKNRFLIWMQYFNYAARTNNSTAITRALAALDPENHANKEFHLEFENEQRNLRAFLFSNINKNFGWFFSIINNNSQNLRTNSAVVNYLNNLSGKYSADSAQHLAIRYLLVKIGAPRGNDTLAVIRQTLIERRPSSDPVLAAIRREIFGQNIYQLVQQRKFSEAESEIAYLGTANDRSYFRAFVKLNEFRQTGNTAARGVVAEYVADIVRHNRRMTLPTDRDSAEYYNELEKLRLCADYYNAVGQYDNALTINDRLIAQVDRNNLSEVYQAVNISRAESYAGLYAGTGRATHKTNYANIVAGIDLSRLSNDQKIVLSWAAARISQRDRTTTEVDTMLANLHVSENGTPEEKALLAEIQLIRADILFARNDNESAGRAVRTSENLHRQLVSAGYYQGNVATEMENKIDQRNITLSLRTGDFAKAQTLLEKQLGLTEGYTPQALARLKTYFDRRTRNDQKVDMLMTLAQVLLLNRQTRERVIGQRQKIDTITSFFAANRNMFSTDEDKLRYITFQISKNTFDYNYRRTVVTERRNGRDVPVMDRLVAEGNALFNSISRNEANDRILTGYFQAASRNYFEVAKGEGLLRDDYLEKASLMNGRAADIEGTNQSDDVRILRADIARNQLASRSFWERIELTNASMTMINEIKTNTVVKNEHQGGLTAQNTETAESRLQTYRFDLEAAYPFTSNFFLFGRAGMEFTSGYQQINRTGDQLVYSNDFGMYFKENIEGNETRNLSMQFKAVDIGLRPYYRGLFDNTYLRTDIFADISGRYEKLFPGMQDQKAVGTDYFSHSWTAGLGMNNKIYPLPDQRDLFYLNIDGEGYVRRRYNQMLPDVTYNASDYDMATGETVDNNVYDSEKNNLWSYFYNFRIGMNFVWSNFFGGLGAGVQSYREGYYDPLSAENSVITNPYIESYLGVNLPYDFQASVGFFRKFGENEGNSYTAEISRNNFFVRGSWFNASKSSYDWNNLYNSGRGESTTDIFKVEAGWRKRFSFLD